MDEADLGHQLLEAIDRLAVAEKFKPGAVAAWALEVDGATYDVRVSRRPAETGESKK